MNFSCEKNTLAEAVGIVQKAVSTKSNVPVLEGILIEAAGESIKLSSNDLELAIENEIEANVSVEGSIVINSKMFGDIIRKLDGDIVYVITDNEYNIQIKCGKSEFELTGIPGSEFPEIKAIEKDSELRVNDRILKNMIKQTVFAAGTDENRIVFTGSLFEKKGDTLYIVSVDGFKLALRKEKVDGNNEDLICIIPAKALNEIMKIIREEGKDINISVGENKVMFEMEYGRVISRLIDGEFINYNQIIPEDNTTTAKIDTHRLCDSVERAALIVENESTKFPVKLNVNVDKIDISCISKSGKFYDSIDAMTSGDELEIGFNCKHLSDVLRNCEDDTVILEFSTSQRACVIRPMEGGRFLFLVMPVRLKN